MIKPNNTATRIATQEYDITNFNPSVNISVKKKLLIITKMYEANTPKTNPKGIPINPRIVASKNTFFLICFLVAPMLLSIPYCFIFSVIEISKLFLMQNIDVTTIIPQAIATIMPRFPTAFSSNGLFSNKIKY